VLGNHDRSRLASRLGPEQARVAAMLLLTLRGTPTIYQGEEIGMTDGAVPPDRLRDPWELRVPGLGLGRDPARTPMQWDASPGAGFTEGAEPWLPLAAGSRRVNVAAQVGDPASMLSLYRALLRLRRAEPALSIGRCDAVSAEGDLLTYQRWHPAGGRRLLVALNLGAVAQVVEEIPAGARLLLSTDPGWRGGEPGGTLRLGPAEGVVVAHAA
jgi:alpha-glucosidase